MDDDTYATRGTVFPQLTCNRAHLTIDITRQFVGTSCRIRPDMIVHLITGKTSGNKENLINEVIAIPVVDMEIGLLRGIQQFTGCPHDVLTHIMTGVTT